MVKRGRRGRAEERLISIRGRLNDRRRVWERDVLSFRRFSSRAQIKEITLHLASFPIQDRRVFHAGAARSQWPSAEGVYLCCCSSGRQDVFYSRCVPRTPISFTPLRASSVLPCHSRGPFASGLESLNQRLFVKKSPTKALNSAWKVL